MGQTFKDESLTGIWALDFRPKSLEEIVLPKRLKTSFQKFIDEEDVPNLLLVSPNPGTGKTSIAKILVKKLDADVLFLNGSQDNGIDVLRTTISRFAENSSLFGKRKIVFLDESDGLTPAIQKALRMFMEDYAKNVRFIMTANYKDSFIEPLLSRLRIVDFELQKEESVLMMKEFMERINNIFKERDIEYDNAIIAAIIREYFPDYRSIWTKLQEIYDAHGKITNSGVMSKKSIDKIIDCINKKDIGMLRSVLSELKDVNYTTIYSHLFKRIDDIKLDLRNVAINLAIYQEKMTRVPDKCLNFLGCVADMLMSEGE